MALCADLERQFEFVQHSWLNSSTFHGLTNEADPIAGPGKAGPESHDRIFTIPTAAGPLTLQDVQSYINVRGGGYFFLPSLAALKYLATLAAARAPAAVPEDDFSLLSQRIESRPRQETNLPAAE